MGKIADRLLNRYKNAQGSGSPATANDVRRLSRELDKGFNRTDVNRQSRIGTAGRAVRMVNRGFRNIGTSMNTPYDNRRPKISQLPARRSDMSISLHANLEKMKMPGLRGTTISGKRKKKNRGGFVLG